MFGTVLELVKPEAAQSTATNSTSPLVDQAQAFFAGFGGKVSIGSAPRPLRPGAPPPRRSAPYPAPTAATYRSSFAAPGDDAAARAREQEMAAEADIIDDTFSDFDAPGC